MTHKHILRTRFKKQIVAEFLPPAKPSDKVIILLAGAPSVPEKEELIRFLSKAGYWVLFPRYRGTWESGGKFLDKSPTQDILDIISQLSKGFKNLWKDETLKLKSEEIFVIGSSFGGAAAILTSLDSRVKKSIALSPVIDWRSQTKTDQPLEKIIRFMKTGFGQAYRPASSAVWRKLKQGKFYNPMAQAKKIDGQKIMIIHCQDDKITSFEDSKKFAKITQAKLLSFKTGGHFSLSDLLRPSIFRRVNAFLKK